MRVDIDLAATMLPGLQMDGAVKACPMPEKIEKAISRKSACSFDVAYVPNVSG